MGPWKSLSTNKRRKYRVEDPQCKPSVTAKAKRLAGWLPSLNMCETQNCMELINCRTWGQKFW